MVKDPPAAPYDPLFDDAWIKWAWAAVRGDQLKADIAPFLDTKVNRLFTTRSEYEPELHAFRILIDEMLAPVARWGALFGEILHSYRSAFDNAAWAAVQRGSRPPSALSRFERYAVAFPCADSGYVFDDRRGKRKPERESHRHRLPGVRPTDLAVARWAQPYRLPKRRRPVHPLVFLSEKNNLDKHKSIQGVLLSSVGYYPHVVQTFNCQFTRATASFPDTLKVDTEVARVYVRKTGPNPDLEVNGTLAVGVMAGQGVSTDEFFKKTRLWVSQVLLRFSKAPPDLGKRLGLEP